MGAATKGGGAWSAEGEGRSRRAAQGSTTAGGGRAVPNNGGTVDRAARAEGILAITATGLRKRGKAG